MRIGSIANPAALVLALTGALAAGCTEPPKTVAGARLYAIDQTGGAKLCVAPETRPTDGKEVAVEIRVANDGGWCGLSVPHGGLPYSAGLLTTRPAHGKVYVHTVGSATRIDYTPAAGFAGADGFAVRMVPGDAVIRVTVSVVK